MSALLDDAAVAARMQALADAWRADPQLAAVWLFGSRASGRARPWSDIDLAIAFADALTPARRASRRAQLWLDASTQLGTDAIDLVVLEDAPTVLAQRIVANGQLWVVRDERRTVAIIEDVLRRYLDEAPLRATLDAGLTARLREGRYAG